MFRARSAAAFLALAFASLHAADRLTLEQARDLALKNHPRIQTAQALTEASEFVPKEIRSRYYPTLTASATGAGAPGTTSSIQAGFLTNSTVYSRVAGGVTVNQLIADFGRTHHLAESASLHAKALTEFTNASKADILLEVTRAYYEVLRAQAVLTVAKETVSERQVVVNQVKTLADNKLKSELDVTFAQVNLDEAKLLLSSAENEARGAMAQLNQAIGSGEGKTFELVAEEKLPELPADLAALVPEAIRERPEAREAELEIASAKEFTKAEVALKRPTVSGVFTAGYSPLHSDKLDDHWVAGGVNIDLPLLNGGLYTARRAEAEAKQRAAAQAARDLANRISRDVRLAYLAAVNAKENLQLTAELLEQSDKSLRLAKARYDLGLGTIVELTQAQLNVTRAQIAVAGARFEYQSRRAALDYEMGVNR